MLLLLRHAERQHRNVHVLEVLAFASSATLDVRQLSPRPVRKQAHSMMLLLILVAVYCCCLLMPSSWRKGEKEIY